MKWIFVFLSGALVGAIGSLVVFGGASPGSLPGSLPAPVLVARATAVDVAPLAADARPAPAAAAPVAPAAVATVVAEPLLVPVAGVSVGQLRDTFAETRGTERRHEAIDIPAPKGTQVLAVADGKVVKLFDSKPGGLTVYQFDTREKLAYYYAHLDGYAAGVEEGTVLRRGDLVGYVGTTGNADPATPHLHFAVFELGPEKLWWKGVPLNPYPLLGGAPRP